MEKELYDPSKPFNEQIRRLIKPTQPASGPITVRQFGKRFILEKDNTYLKDFYEMTCSDTLGTKGALHWKMNTIENGAQDAFAMVVDDLIEGGFVPAILQNEILVEQEDPVKIFSAIKGLVKLCIQNQWNYGKGKSNPIAISGGETAILNTLQGFEMGVTATGYVRKGSEIASDAKRDDIIIGLGSSGVHTNGMSFFREEFFKKRKMQLDAELPWGVTVGEELTKPTNVYLPAVKALIDRLQKGDIHGMVHITGGGLSKLRELAPKKDVDIRIERDNSLKPQEIFSYTHEELGVPSGKMYERFNNGIGYVIAVDPDASKTALSILRKYFKADRIGQVNKGSGRVLIESAYDSGTVEYK